MIVVLDRIEVITHLYRNNLGSSCSMITKKVLPKWQAGSLKRRFKTAYHKRFRVVIIKFGNPHLPHAVVVQWNGRGSVTHRRKCTTKCTCVRLVPIGLRPRISTATSLFFFHCKLFEPVQSPCPLRVGHKSSNGDVRFLNLNDANSSTISIDNKENGRLRTHRPRTLINPNFHRFYLDKKYNYYPKSLEVQKAIQNWEITTPYL